jgi:Holliday junction resolvase RusA-like endonuclease
MGAIRVDREYIFPRPKCHAKTKYHTVKPDIDNLDKALFDALQGMFFTGDQQICVGILVKRYTNLGEKPGVIAKFTLLGG